MKLAIVTGASRGFGLALATQLRREGWRVVGLSRTAASSDDIAVDLRHSAALARAFALASVGVDDSTLDEIVVVHNAASIGPIRSSGHLGSDAIDDTVAVNLGAGLRLFDAALARWQAHPARKVLAAVGSGAALNPHAGLSVYSATKAALEQHLRVLALEQTVQLHPFVAVIVDPGTMDTDMQAALRSASAADVPSAPDFARRHQEGLLAGPSVVAAWAAALLRSPRLVGGTRHHVRDGLPG